MGNLSEAMRLLITIFLASVCQGYRPLRPQVKNFFPIPSVEDVGEPLYLTPYVESGNLETGRELAKVDSSLLQGSHNQSLESYSGLFTVDPDNNGNMFFWFFPAMKNSETAPVVIWLQGGPGGSSLFGLLKLHGPILTGTDENGNFGVNDNPYSWHREHNMLYIDNPVGAGFSYSDKLPRSQDDVSQNLYNLLQQWFTLFPMYQENEFYPFGESYAGKFVYQVGLIDENDLQTCLDMEEETQALIEKEEWESAWHSWNNEFSYFLNKMDYSY